MNRISSTISAMNSVSSCGRISCSHAVRSVPRFCDMRSRTITPFKYPAYDSFVDSVRLEAEQNVRRLRHHPSLVIWGSYPLPSPPLPLTHDGHIPAGNNEGTVAPNHVILDI
jgi:hypothetical protein